MPSPALGHRSLDGVAGLGHPLESVFLSFIGGVEPFILLAVPLFIFAGELLAHGGVGARIVAFARVLFGWLIRPIRYHTAFTMFPPMRFMALYR